MAFWSGFAQGYTAEKDRIEARKQYQDALDAKKKDMVLQIAQRRAELGMTSGAGDGGEGYKAWSSSLAQMGMDPEKIAKIASEGGMPALKALRDAVVKNYDPKNPMSPEDLNAFADNSFLSISGGGSVDIESLAGDAGVTLNPTEQEFFQTMTTTPPSVELLTPLPKAAPVGMDEVNQALTLAKGKAGDVLLEKMSALQKEMAAPNLTPDEARVLAEEFTKYQTAKSNFDNGVINPALELVGQDVMADVIATNPRLAESPLISSFGVRRFVSEAEAEAAISAGQVPPNARFYVGNQLYENK